MVIAGLALKAGKGLLKGALHTKLGKSALKGAGRALGLKSGSKKRHFSFARAFQRLAAAKVSSKIMAMKASALAKIR